MRRRAKIPYLQDTKCCAAKFRKAAKWLARAPKPRSRIVDPTLCGNERQREAQPKRSAEELVRRQAGQPAGCKEDAHDGTGSRNPNPMPNIRIIHSRWLTKSRRRAHLQPFTKQNRNSTSNSTVADISLMPPIAIRKLIASAEIPITKPKTTATRPIHRCTPGARLRNRLMNCGGAIRKNSSPGIICINVKAEWCPNPSSTSARPARGPVTSTTVRITTAATPISTSSTVPAQIARAQNLFGVIAKTTATATLMGDDFTCQTFTDQRKIRNRATKHSA